MVPPGRGRCHGRKPGGDGPAPGDNAAMQPLCTPDHLVLAATTLAQGIDWIADLTGVAARPGGKHVAMGTHNALLRLGERLYLEIIAIDPHGAKPARPRWFDLDNGDLRADLLEHPRLIHWVARTDDIARAVAQAGYDTGPMLPFERGPYRWRITVPDDGSRPGRGVLPTLIQWDVPDASGGRATRERHRARAARGLAPGSQSGPRVARAPGPRGRHPRHLRPGDAPGGAAANAARAGRALEPRF